MDNPEEALLVGARSRARMQGIAFSITVDDIYFPLRCPVLGIPLRWHVGEDKRGHADSFTLDRIKPHLGYVSGNVRVISRRANTLKNNASVEEMRLVLADLEAIHA